MFLITLASTSTSMYSMFIIMDIDDDHIPFELAAQAIGNNRNPEALEVLISIDSSLATRRDQLNSTLLHYAAAQCDERIIRALIRAGAAVNAQDINELTPLHVAALRGDYRITRILLAAGADIRMLDYKSRSPLDMAVDKGHSQVAETLMDFLIGIEAGQQTNPEYLEPRKVMDALPEWFWDEHSALAATKTSMIK